MPATVKTRIVQIGNSPGIRTPRLLHDHKELGEEGELELHQVRIIARAWPRQTWEEAFKVMADARDDGLLDPDLPTGTPWDGEEWEW